MTDQHLPHQVKLAEMEFGPLVMPVTDCALKHLGGFISLFYVSMVKPDLMMLGHSLTQDEWLQLGRAASASLAHVIFNNLNADQKEVLRSLLAKE